MNLNYDGGNKKIIQAVDIANKILKDPAFYQQIEGFNSFAYSIYSGQQVAAELRNAVMEIKVNTYWYPFGSATAKTKTEININTAKLKRSIASIVNTVIHESVHFVDWAVNQKWDYTDRNAYEEPPISASYKIGDLAERLTPIYS